jgi:glycosyltransferase involved in cell wall biosynthesis
MKVGFLCNEYPGGPHGGIGTLTQVLGRGLVRAGHQVWVIGRYSWNHPAPDYEEDQGVRVWRLRAPADRLGSALCRLKLLRTLANWSRKGEIDLIEAPDCAGWIAGLPPLPVPVIVRVNGSVTYLASELGRPVNRLLFLFEWATLKRADFWCAVSRYAAEKTQRLFHLRSSPVILYNPMEAPVLEAGTTRSKNRVVFTGTLTAKKGIVPLIKAWPRVRERHKDAELHIFGKDRAAPSGGSMHAFLRSQMDGDSAGSVRLYGHVTRDKIFHALQTARLAVFPSYAEAFALAPMEAMASGCPTIFTRRTSGSELISDGENGLLVDPDRPDEIAEAINRVLGDDALAESLGRAGRMRIEQDFSVPALVAQNESFYRHCLGRFRRSALAAHPSGL